MFVKLPRARVYRPPMLHITVLILETMTPCHDCLPCQAGTCGVVGRQSAYMVAATQHLGMQCHSKSSNPCTKGAKHKNLPVV